jgi:2-polyprenyl-3-methyl-5-hydroxy-6-metoxy-1,4-benzoquinol methylase
MIERPSFVRDNPDNPDEAFAELYAQLPDVTDPEPWLGWARKAKPPVLYLGIGTGRIAVPLARAGIQLVGVDAHPGMLRRLAERLPTVELIQARIEDLDLDRRFDLVMVPSDILSTTPRLQRAALHVAPGGRLAFEMMNPHWLKAVSHPGVRVRSMTTARVDMEVDYRLPDGSVRTQEAHDAPLIWPEDVEPWLKTAGLRLERLSGSGDGDLRTSATYYVVSTKRPVRG